MDHPRHVRRYLALIAVLVAVSTSLIGPTAFMGIFVANIAYALAGSVRHRIVLPPGCAIAIAIFLAAQLLVEHVFNYKTTVSILVNLVRRVFPGADGPRPRHFMIAVRNLHKAYGAKTVLADVSCEFPPAASPR